MYSQFCNNAQLYITLLNTWLLTEKMHGPPWNIDFSLFLFILLHKNTTESFYNVH